MLILSVRSLIYPLIACYGNISQMAALNEMTRNTYGSRT